MITGINHVTWNVDDVDAAFRFDVDVLGLRPVMRSSRSAYLLAGDTWLAIVQGERRSDGRSDHVAFQVDPASYDAMVERMRGLGVPEWKDDESEGESFSFLDPSGNRVELHSSSLTARIADGKSHRGPGVRWYDDGMPSGT